MIANCISESGHELRPGYCNLRQMRQQFPVIALTVIFATPASH